MIRELRAVHLAGGGEPGAPDEILVAFAEPAEQRRLTVLVRIILAIPHLVVLYVLSIASEVVALICWFAALFTGRLPGGLADFQVGYLRWLTRFSAYLFLLTDVYPPFEFAEAQYPVRLRAEPGPLNRLAVLFRIILVIPASIVSCGPGLRPELPGHVRDLADRAHRGPDAAAAARGARGRRCATTSG